VKVFVYGTLMKGQFNHSILRDPAVKFLGSAVTQRGFTLYDLGSFPGMVMGGSNSIIGEIYEVDRFTLMQLDGLESHPTFYKRTKIKLQCGKKVQTYLLNNEYIVGCPVIKSGDWKFK